MAAADEPGMKRTPLGIWIAVATALALAGVSFVLFSPRRLDGSSEAAFRASVDAITAGMSAAHREEFERALAKLSIAVLVPPQGGGAAGFDPAAAQQRVRQSLDGLSAAQVIERAAAATGAAGPAARPDADRAPANEAAAVQLLTQVAAGQARLRAMGAIDENRNRVGEYGFLAELAGMAVLRGTAQDRADPALLPAPFQQVVDSVVVHSGYVFRVWLPGPGGAFVGERGRGGARDGSVAPDQAELFWCAYAWPQRAGETGQRAFFVDRSGVVLQSGNDDGRYSGPGRGPEPGAAYAGAGAALMHDKPADGGSGRDGQVWTRVQ